MSDTIYTVTATVPKFSEDDRAVERVLYTGRDLGRAYGAGTVLAGVLVTLGYRVTFYWDGAETGRQGDDWQAPSRNVAISTSTSNVAADGGPF